MFNLLFIYREFEVASNLKGSSFLPHWSPAFFCGAGARSNWLDIASKRILSGNDKNAAAGRISNNFARLKRLNSDATLKIWLFCSENTKIRKKASNFLTTAGKVTN